MSRRSVLVLLFCLFAFPACALDEIQGVSAAWNDFVSALRRGDYLNAHGLFSAQSRSAMPYPEFVGEYGPLSAAREMILAKPDSLSTRVDGDWGEITYGGVNPGTGRKFSVGVSFVRNSGGWGLVAARNENLERVEAGARGLLRLLWENREHGAPRDLVAALTRAQAGNPVFRFYRLETDGERFVAFPSEDSLRVFFVNAWGEVQAVDRSSPAGSPSQPRRELVGVPAASAIAPKAPRARAPEAGAGNVDAFGLPELSDPGVAAPAPQLSDWEEPPMPSAAGAVPATRAPAVSLPDTIR